MNYSIYFDGASRNNPGLCSSSGIIYDYKKNLLFKKVTKYECNTNNFAEYNGLINGLELAIENKLENDKIIVYGDSLLVINQVNNIWKCRADNLKLLHKQAKNLVKNFKDIQFVHIPRENNKVADKFCNEILDKDI
jgi:ribonuclease HI